MRPHNGLGCVSLRYPGWKVTTAGRILPLAATYLPPALSGPGVFGRQRPFPAGSAYLPTPWGWRIPAVVTFQPG